MKNFKTIFLALSFLGLVFTSCMDEKSEKKDTDQTEINSELKNNTEKNINNDEKMMVSNNNSMAIRTTNNDVKAMQISGWSSFNELSIEMKKLENADFSKMKTTLPMFEKTIASLNSTRPEWMMTEEIREDVEDVQKEYNELIADKNAGEKEYKENIEELNEAYDDLVEEINETFDEYVKINRKANEEYREEAKDGEMEDAREEYNEEIKKLNEITDDKK